MTTRRPGGGNLIVSDLTTNAGVISRYHLDQAKVDKILDDAVADGQRSLGIPMLLQQDVPSGEPFIDWKDGMLTDRMEKNFRAYVKRAKGAGFRFFLLAPQFYNEHDFRANPNFENEWDRLFGHIARFHFEQLKPVMEDVNTDWVDDLVTEGLGDRRGCVERVMKTIYTMWTAYWWSDGVPCWDAAISFVPNAAAVKDMLNIYRGLDPNGPVNSPRFHIPHPYTHSMLLDLRTLKTWIDSLGLAPAAWLFGETDTLTANDAAVCEEVRQFVVDTKQPIESIFQWGLLPGDFDPTGKGPQWTVIPSRWSDGWGRIAA